MKTITRSHTLQVPAEHVDQVHQEACQLFENHWPLGNPIRLLGITLQNLIPKEESAIQLDMFDYGKQPGREKLNETMDRLRDKFGEHAVLTAGMLSDDPSALIRDHKRRGTSLQMDHLRSKDKEEDEN